MEREPTCPLLVGRGFLATTSAVIDCKKAKIAVGEGLSRKRESYTLRTSEDGIGSRPPYYAKRDFLNNYASVEWDIARDAEVIPFKDVLVFRKMVEFLGAIPINLKGNMIELIDPDGEKFDRAFQSILATRKLSPKENPSDILNLDHFHDS
ncbi:hypothetical protein Tco_1310507 [Tanacetum coccineum]